MVFRTEFKISRALKNYVAATVVVSAASLIYYKKIREQGTFIPSLLKKTFIPIFNGIQRSVNLSTLWVLCILISSTALIILNRRILGFLSLALTALKMTGNHLNYFPTIAQMFSLFRSVPHHSSGIRNTGQTPIRQDNNKVENQTIPVSIANADDSQTTSPGSDNPNPTAQNLESLWKEAVVPPHPSATNISSVGDQVLENIWEETQWLKDAEKVWEDIFTDPHFSWEASGKKIEGKLDCPKTITFLKTMLLEVLNTTSFTNLLDVLNPTKIPVSLEAKKTLMKMYGQAWTKLPGNQSRY
jgi:hypothetical protein